MIVHPMSAEVISFDQMSFFHYLFVILSALGTISPICWITTLPFAMQSHAIEVLS